VDTFCRLDGGIDHNDKAQTIYLSKKVKHTIF